MATSAEIKTSIDTNITNKIIPGSIDNTLVGANIKSVVDYVDQEITAMEALIPSINYTHYLCIMTQSSTANPVVNNILENTMNGPIVWTRISEGIYEGVLVGAFTNQKTALSITPIGVGVDYSIFQVDTNTIQIKTWNNQTGAFVDGQLNKTTIEIKSYS
jgi:hypothetical protein